MLDAVLRKRLRVGNLKVRIGDGPLHVYGDGSGPEVIGRLTPAAAARIGLRPELALGECYMDGSLVLEQGSIWDLLATAGRNYGETTPRKAKGLEAVMRDVRRRIDHYNDRAAARRNVAHHYDLSYELYRRFLDADMQYSCAYFSRPDMTLEEAQEAKRIHIATKLQLEPGQRVLDIGCGWGGLALHIASRHDVSVLGVTLSKEQLAIAQRRAEAAGLSHRVEFRLTDYRDIKGQFDRIVSVGMFEHVGVPNYRTYFDTIRRLLTPQGNALIHSIGRKHGPALTQPWIRRYIFPGGYIPALSEVTPEVEASGLWVTDVEILRLHYAETLRHWRERFVAVWGDMAALYDERFCRMWEFYLAVSELAFRYMGHMNFQIQLTRKVDALPITRDYMIDAERAAPKSAPVQLKGVKGGLA